MIDNDVPLNCVVGLPFPFARSFIEIEVIAEGQFLQSRRFHLVRVMDDDFGSDIVTVPIPFGQNSADRIFVDIVLRNEAGVVSDDDGLALVGLEAFRRENLFREPKFPPDRSVRVGVLEDTRAGQDRPVDQVSLGREVGLVQRKAIQAYHTGQLWGHRAPTPFRVFMA